MSILDILSQAIAANNPDQHFDKVVAHAPANELGKGVAEAFRSDKTPEIGQMVGQLFGNSNSSQQAGMINQVIASLGPAAFAALAGGVLSRLAQTGGMPAGQAAPQASAPTAPSVSAAPVQITPAQASTLSTDQVKDIVNSAQKQNPDLAEQLGKYYAEHSGLIKTLGAAALAITMARMKNNMENKG